MTQPAPPLSSNAPRRSSNKAKRKESILKLRLNQRNYCRDLIKSITGQKQPVLSDTPYTAPANVDEFYCTKFGLSGRTGVVRGQETDVGFKALGNSSLWQAFPRAGGSPLFPPRSGGEHGPCVTRSSSSLPHAVQSGHLPCPFCGRGSL